MTEEIRRRVDAATAEGEELLAALRSEIARLALPGEPIVIPPFASACFKLESDPYSGGQTLRAAFHRSRSYCIGFLLFHADGGNFAEYHVMQPHPSRAGMFIEAVEAWTRDGQVKTDIRLAMMPK